MKQNNWCSRVTKSMLIPLVIMLPFQNCTQSFKGLDSADLSSSSNVLKYSSLAASSSQNSAIKTVKEPCDPAQGWICMSEPLLPADTTVGAWYSIYWYAKNEPNAFDRWGAVTRYKPTLGYYDSGEVITHQYAYFKRAGLDYLLLDNTNGFGNDGGLIYRNALRVFDRLPADLPIAMAGGYPLWSAMGQNRDTTIANMGAEANDLWINFAQRSNYLKWLDPATNTYKPLFVVYNSLETFLPNDDHIRDWTDSRFSVRRAAGGMTTDNPNLQRYRDQGLWGWGVFSQIVSQETMAVQPGFHTAHIPGRSAPTILKRNGSSYMNQWLLALKTKPKNIILPSWNDWAEETAIEPGIRTNPSAEMLTDSYGEEVDDWLLQITSGYSNLRKGLMPGFYYRTEDDSTVYKVENGKLVAQGAMPHRKPVILLPAGSLSPYISAVAPTQPQVSTEAVPSSPRTNQPVVRESAISEGLFKVGINIYYSNGGNYCQFDSMNSFTSITGKNNVNDIRSLNGIPAVMRNDGYCQVPTANSQVQQPISEGLFVVGVSIYYSNGGAYCYFPTMALFTQRTGRTNIKDIRVFTSIPSVMPFDGLCK